MIYVVIDIAKLNHFASAIFSDDETLIEPFKFTNECSIYSDNSHHCTDQVTGLPIK